jgi:hypothetical protein
MKEKEILGYSSLCAASCNFMNIFGDHDFSKHFMKFV